MSKLLRNLKIERISLVTDPASVDSENPGVGAFVTLAKAHRGPSGRNFDVDPAVVEKAKEALRAKIAARVAATRAAEAEREAEALEKGQREREAAQMRTELRKDQFVPELLAEGYEHAIEWAKATYLPFTTREEALSLWVNRTSAGHGWYERYRAHELTGEAPRNPGSVTVSPVDVPAPADPTIRAGEPNNSLGWAFEKAAQPLSKAETELSAKVAALRKADPNLDFGEAMHRVCKENPDLYHAHRASAPIVHAD